MAVEQMKAARQGLGTLSNGNLLGNIWWLLVIIFGITQGYVGIMGVCRDIEGLYRENEKMEATI